MRITTALRKRDKAMLCLKETYAMAKLFKYSHARLLEDITTILDSISKCPEWVSSYVRGAREILNNQLYQYELEYCSIIDGKVVSHNNKSERYYGKLGYASQQVYEQGTQRGHYWRDTDKPYFLGT